MIIFNVQLKGCSFVGLGITKNQFPAIIQLNISVQSQLQSCPHFLNKHTCCQLFDRFSGKYLRFGANVNRTSTCIPPRNRLQLGYCAIKQHINAYFVSSIKFAKSKWQIFILCTQKRSGRKIIGDVFVGRVLQHIISWYFELFRFTPMPYKIHMIMFITIWWMWKYG